MGLRDILRDLAYNKKTDSIGNKKLTVPNLITGFGILLTLIYVFMYATHTLEFFIPAMILGIGLSDFLDGLLARILNQHSTLGKFLDPLRDRLMMVAVLINIALFIDGINYIIFALILIMECLIVLINGLAKFKYQLSVEVHFVGKLRLLVHASSALIFAFMLYWPDFNPAWTSIDPNLLLFVMLASSIFATGSYLGKLISSVYK